MHFCTFTGCFASYEKLWRLKEHEMKHTGERPFVCTIDGCGKSYCRSAHLRRHAKSHSGQKDFVCLEDGCKLRFVCAQNLKKHLKRFHLQNHKCEFEGCGEIFKKRRQLKTHQVTHTGVNPYRCEVEGCGMQFPSPSKLKKHMQKHEGRNCPRDGCDEIFKSWSLLRKHISTEHCEELHCDQCGKTFMKKHKLRLHQRVHKDKIEVFVCPREGCDRTYTRMSYLKLHINNYHEGARPFACTNETCTKTFAHKVSLKKHQVVHTLGYVKPEPKPRKSRSTASKISGVVCYVEKQKTQVQSIATTDKNSLAKVHEHPNTFHANKDVLKQNSSVDKMHTQTKATDNKDKSIDEIHTGSTLIPAMDSDDKSISGDSELHQEDIISNKTNDCKNSNQQCPKSLPLTILESIECH